MKSTVESEIKEQMTEYFVKDGREKGRRPANFRGFDDDSTASCELKKRSTRSALSDEEVELLENAGVEFDTVEDVTECFVINPEYKDDQKLLGKVSKALEKVPGLPDDFIVLQKGKNRRVVTDESLEQIFKLNIDEIKKLIEVVGVLAIKPKLNNSDLKKALDIVKEMIEE